MSTIRLPDSSIKYQDLLFAKDIKYPLLLYRIQTLEWYR